MEQDRNNKNPVFRSLAVIEENIQRKLTVESLAKSIHLSRYHYQRLFREIMGDSVMRYVSRRRIALAAADLTETDESIRHCPEIRLRLPRRLHPQFPGTDGGIPKGLSEISFIRSHRKKAKGENYHD